MPMSSHFANRKWSFYLENKDSSVEIIIKYIFEIIWNYPLRKGWEMHNIFCILFILG